MSTLLGTTNRRVLLLGALLLAAPLLAGCTTQTDQPDTPGDTGDTGDPGDGGDGGDGGDTGTDGGDGGDGGTDAVFERGTPTQPSPAGEALSQADIDALLEFFTDQPYTGGQETPGHVFKFVSPETFIFLHFAEAEPEDFSQLLYIGTGVKGVACAETQSDGADGGFTHFHKHSSATWEGGHGGAAGDEGYWFQHIAVDTFDMPWGTVTPGVDYGFMPTPPQACGDDVPEPTFDAGGMDELSSDEVAALVAAFDDQPFMGGQGSPSHVAKWVNEDAFIFLHFDTPDPLDATKLLYFGPGVRGEACTDKQPHSDFTHFHKWTAASWEGGHGGAAGAYGYWLLHNGADWFEMPWGPVDPGVDQDFMPTPADACPA